MEEYVYGPIIHFARPYFLLARRLVRRGGGTDSDVPRRIRRMGSAVRGDPQQLPGLAQLGTFCRGVHPVDADKNKPDMDYRHIGPDRNIDILKFIF